MARQLHDRSMRRIPSFSSRSAKQPTPENCESNRMRTLCIVGYDACVAHGGSIEVCVVIEVGSRKSGCKSRLLLSLICREKGGCCSYCCSGRRWCPGRHPTWRQPRCRLGRSGCVYARDHDGTQPFSRRCRDSEVARPSACARTTGSNAWCSTSQQGTSCCAQSRVACIFACQPESRSKA